MDIETVHIVQIVQFVHIVQSIPELTFGGCYRAMFMFAARLLRL